MLKLWRSIQFPLLSPDDNTGLGGGGDKESIIDFLGADDDKEPETIDLKTEKPIKETEKAGDDTPPESDDDEDTNKDDKDDDEDEEVDELDELEEELEGPTDEQLELVTPVRRQEILKKYPKLFKDFPYLEKNEKKQAEAYISSFYGLYKNQNYMISMLNNTCRTY